MRQPEGTGGLLLVPVSGGGGSGELQRAVLLAREVRSRWPQQTLAICAEAAALGAIALPEGLRPLPLPASPTRCTALVRAAIEEQRPRVVIFDSTARPRQLAAARQAGAGVIYLSSRPSARARGFRFGALACIDEHWSVEFDPKQRLPGAWQRLCLRWRRACRWRALGTLHEFPDPAGLPPPVREFARAGAHGLWCPGGGGGEFAGQPVAAAFAAAAQACGARAIVVRRDLPPGQVELQDPVLLTGPLQNAALMALLGGAAYAMVGAGSLLLQALACGTPCAAVALASDQPARLRHLVGHGATLAGGRDIEGLAAAARRLANEAGLREQLRQRARGLGLRNGLEEALAALARWLA